MPGLDTARLQDSHEIAVTVQTDESRTWLMSVLGGNRTFGSTTLLLLLAESGLTSVGFK